MEPEEELLFKHYGISGYTRDEETKENGPE